MSRQERISSGGKFLVPMIFKIYFKVGARAAKVIFLRSFRDPHGLLSREGENCFAAKHLKFDRSYSNNIILSRHSLKLLTRLFSGRFTHYLAINISIGVKISI